MASDAMVLRFQDNSTHSVQQIFIELDQFCAEMLHL